MAWLRFARANADAKLTYIAVAPWPGPPARRNSGGAAARRLSAGTTATLNSMVAPSGCVLSSGTLSTPQRAAMDASRSGCSRRHSCSGSIGAGAGVAGAAVADAAAATQPQAPITRAVNALRIPNLRFSPIVGDTVRFDMSLIREADVIASVADALQYISYYHTPDFIRAMGHAYDVEQSPSARDAIAQILTNSRMCAEGHRPICQDTGIVVVFVKVGMGVTWDAKLDLEAMINEG